MANDGNYVHLGNKRTHFKDYFRLNSSLIKLKLQKWRHYFHSALLFIHFLQMYSLFVCSFIILVSKPDYLPTILSALQKIKDG